MSNMPEKPNASLTAKEVHEIVCEIDNRIVHYNREQNEYPMLSDQYMVALKIETELMNIRTLILTKL